MKTFRRLKATAVAVLVILLALNFVFITALLIQKSVKPEELSLPEPKWYRTADIEVVEEVICNDYGLDIIKMIEKDENVRVSFFAELTDFLTKKYTIKVLDIKIAENKNICIRFIPDINKQNPRNRYLVRLAPFWRSAVFLFYFSFWDIFTIR